MSDWLYRSWQRVRDNPIPGETVNERIERLRNAWRRKEAEKRWEFAKTRLGSSSFVQESGPVGGSSPVAAVYGSVPVPRERHERRNKGLLDAPKAARPGAPREERLGAMFYGGARKGNWKGSYGGSGIDGVRSSYQARSAVQLATNIKSRMRLTAAGYVAMLMSTIANEEMGRFNRAASDAGYPGGALAMPAAEFSKLMSGSLGGYGARIGRTIASSFADATNILFGASQLIMMLSPFGTDEQTAQSVLALEGYKEQVSAAANIRKASDIIMGSKALHETRALIAHWGTRENKAHWEDVWARQIASARASHKFMKSLAADITNDVIGLSEESANEQLLAAHKDRIFMAADYSAQLVDFDKIKPYLGTKE